MNPVDALLLILLCLFALRGYWRGFCREGFGLAGLVVGAFAAAAFGPALADALLVRGLEPREAAWPLAIVLIFCGVSVAAALAGRITERLAQALFLGGVNRLGGAVVGAAKGAALLAFALVVVERAAPHARPAIAASRVGRPLAQLAAEVIDHARSLEPEPAQPAPAQEHV